MVGGPIGHINITVVIGCDKFWRIESFGSGDIAPSGTAEFLDAFVARIRNEKIAGGVQGHRVRPGELSQTRSACGSPVGYPRGSRAGIGLDPVVARVGHIDVRDTAGNGHGDPLEETELPQA